MTSAASFVGVTVKLTLKDPPGTILHGTVSEVIPETSTLLLQHVYFPQTKQSYPEWRVVGSQIDNIEISQLSPFPTEYPQPSPQYANTVGPERTSPQQQATAQSEASIPIPVQTPQQEFMDPAIVSFGRKPSQQLPPTAMPNVTNMALRGGADVLQEAPSTPVEKLDSRHPKFAPQHPPSHKPSRPHRNNALGIREGRDAAATLTAPFSGLDIRGAQEEELPEETAGPPLPQDAVRRVSINKTRTGKPMDDPQENKKKTRRGLRKKNNTSQEQAVTDGQGSSPEAARKSNGNSAYRGKGWRQTPMLQDSNSGTPQRTPGLITGPVGRQAASSVKRCSRKQRAMELEAERNGWGTEEATDIQELPEFDFEGNLSKFDKRTIFEQMRHEDGIAESDRLVAYNRQPAPRPGTYGGKNLHPTENVLDSPRMAWSGRRSSAISSDSDLSFDLDGGHGGTSRRALSRASTMRNPMRSNSGDAVSIPQAQYPRGPRPQSRQVTTTYAGSSSHNMTSGSPNLNPNNIRFTPPESPSHLLGQPALSVPAGHFRIVGSDRRCPTITPGGMAAIEEVAETEFGLSVEIMNENAGRGIAEVAVRALNPTGRRLARDNLRLNSKPVALVLVGNHRAGARALAAARHLRSRSIKVLACVLGYERVGAGLELEKEVRRQAEMTARLGVVVRGWSEVRNYLARIEERGQPELVIDALLSQTRGFDALGADDQRVVLDAVGWVNRRAGTVVCSVDCPSGVNGSTGESPLLDNPSSSTSISPSDTYTTPLELRSKHIICIGAPRIGLLRALQRAQLLASQSTSTGLEAKNWTLWVVDIGVNRAWKSYGVTPGGQEGGVRFGDEWVVKVQWVSDGLSGEG